MGVIQVECNLTDGFPIFRLEVESGGSGPKTNGDTLSLLCYPQSLALICRISLKPELCTWVLG